MIENIRADKDGKECDVFFFKSWGGYSHPVKPAGPITYEEALRRDGFSRAWMCGLQDNRQFVLFEGVRVSRSGISKTSIDPTNAFYEWVVGTDRVGIVGNPIDASDTMVKSSFVFVEQVGRKVLASLVEQVFMLKFECQYSESGELKRVVTTNSSGETKVLDY